MPLMTSALKTLTAHQVARGSTLLNITQQVASSFGVAIISVLLTNSIESRPLVDQAQKYGDAAKGATDPNQVQQLLERFPEVARVIGQVADPARAQEVLMAAVRSDLAGAFASTYWVSGGLCALTLVVALFLPRKREESHLLDGDEDAEPVHVAMH